MDRPANDTTSEARVVSEVYLIDPTTKKPYAAGGGGGSISAVATADAPTYAEGESEPLSMDLAGNLRIGGTINASTSAEATAAAPAYAEGTEQPLSQTLAGDLRVSAKASGSFPVTGTFWQATQPISAAALPLPSGAASAANQSSALTKLDTLHTDLTTPATELPKTPLMATSDLTPGNVSRSGAGETSMVTATASQTTKLYGYAVTVPGAGTVEIRDGASGTALRKHIFPAAGGIIRDVRSRPYAKTTANTALIFYWSGTGEANIDFDYVKGA